MSAAIRNPTVDRDEAICAFPVAEADRLMHHGRRDSEALELPVSTGTRRDIATTLETRVNPR